MKIKNKTRFRVLCTLYVIGYLFFCIFGGMSSGMMISDSPVLEFAAIYYGLPVGVRNLSVSMFVWLSSRSSSSLLFSGRPTCQNKS